MTDPKALQSLADKLSGVALYADPIDLLNYRRDCSMVAAGRAELAAQASSAEQVVAIVSEAAAHATPVYVRGGGTMYAGGVNPHAGGIVLDVSRMTRVLELDLARGVVVVEPGIRFADLLAQLALHGQTVGIVPSTGPAATVGGAISHPRTGQHAMETSVHNSLFINNRAAYAGGAIYTNTTSGGSIFFSTLANNQAEGPVASAGLRSRPP